MPKELSDSLETTLRPLGTIPHAGIEWPEARSFSRLYCYNPFRQSYLVDTLVALHGTALTHNSETGPTDEFTLSPPPSDIAGPGIVRAIWYLDHEEPQWRKKDYDIEPEWEVIEGRYYDADDELVKVVDQLYAGETLADSETRKNSFLRVHQNNPFAQANLLHTLVGMYRKPREGWSDRPEHVSRMSLGLSTRGIAQTIWYIAGLFPEWAQDELVVSGSSIEEINGATYYREERTLRIVESVINRQEDIMEPLGSELITVG